MWTHSSAGYESLTGKLVKLLERLKNREVSPDYTYYGIASPWLQVCHSHHTASRTHNIARQLITPGPMQQHNMMQFRQKPNFNCGPNIWWARVTTVVQYENTYLCCDTSSSQRHQQQLCVHSEHLVKALMVLGHQQRRHQNVSCIQSQQDGTTLVQEICITA